MAFWSTEHKLFAIMVPNELKTKEACSTKIYAITEGREDVLEPLSSDMNLLFSIARLLVDVPPAPKTQTQL